jgi:hypothetical protein
MKLFKATIECQHCGGTGLYVGMAERDGSAVVCHHCKGTGKVNHEFRYTEFTQRRPRSDVRRVFQSSCGYVHSADNVTTEDGKSIEFSNGGASYADWLGGKKPLPLKNLYCPLQFTGQQWHAPYCKDNFWGGMLTDCPERCNMAACWELWEKDQ